MAGKASACMHREGYCSCCVCVCVCACVRACVRACVCVCLLIISLVSRSRIACVMPVNASLYLFV